MPIEGCRKEVKKPTEGVILSGVPEKGTGLYLDGSLENPVKGAEGVSRYQVSVNLSGKRTVRS